MILENKKKKILYLITKSNWGGAQKYVYDLALGVSNGEFEALVACGGNGELVEKLQEKRIQTISIPRLKRDVNIFNDLYVFFFILDLLRVEQADVLHINSSKIGGIGALAGRIYNLEESTKFFYRKIIFICSSRSRLSRRASSSKKDLLPQIKIIFTVHGWAFGEQKRNSLQKKIIKLFSWFTILLSHKTITVSDFDFKSTKNMPFIQNKVFHIYNGIHNIDFLPQEQARTKLLNEKALQFKNTTWIGTVAELTNNKGLEYGIRAINKLTHNSAVSQFTYVIVGEGEDMEKLQKLIKKLQLDDIVFLVGKKENASKLLKAFDIFLLPSLKEGLPYTLLEAGLAELPTIASNVGGIPEIIKNGISGLLVKAEEVENIAFAIQTLSGNKELAHNYGGVLNINITRKFSLQKMIDSTIQVYQ